MILTARFAQDAEGPENENIQNIKTQPLRFWRLRGERIHLLSPSWKNPISAFKRRD